jgi:predicted dehydrogenase
VTVLIVGGGKMGLSHLALASSLLGRDGTAVCDASIALRFAYRNFGFKTFTSLSTALEQLDGRIDAAIIATPTPSHFPVAKMLLQAGVPCFVEKPLTLNPTQSAELIKIASAAKLHAHVGFVLRYVKTFATLRQLVMKNILGQAKSYRAIMTGNVITKGGGNTWRSDFSKGGGCLNEYGPHLIDLCRYAFGEISDVLEVSATQVHSQQADDKFSAQWSHVSGTAGQINIDWCDTSKRKSVVQFEVDFQYGRLHMDNSAMSFADIQPGDPEVPDRLRHLQSATPPKVTFYLRGEEYSLQLEEFLGRCLGRPLGAPPFGGFASPALLADGLAVDQLIVTLAQKAGLS